jgi:hypothetical protein
LEKSNLLLPGRVLGGVGGGGGGGCSSHTNCLRFWYDKLYEDHVVKDIFLDLYSIACVKDASIPDYLELSSDSHKWNVSFIRDAYDWEVKIIF